jgi:Tfp pilus assembly protein PilF
VLFTHLRQILLSGVLVCAIGASAHAQDAAKVLSAQGSVEREQPPWVPVTVNNWLAVGTRMRTGNEGRAVLLLADETQLKVNANTELQLANVRDASTLFKRVALAASGSQESVLNVSRGQVWLRARNKPAAVKVVTPAVTAAVRGTEFDLRVGANGESVIAVLEGAVDFRNQYGAVEVKTGEQGRARVGEAPTKTVLVNPADAVQWTLVYSGAVSPRDYPIRYPSAAAARAALVSLAPATAASAAGLAVAEARHDAGDLSGALQALGDLATPDAAELRGWILLEQNRPVDALAELDRAPAASARRRLGQSIAAFSLRRYAAAAAATDGTSDSRLLIQKARLELLSGDAGAARRALEDVPASDLAYAQAQALLSNVYLAQDRKDDARRAAGQAVRAAPESPTAWLALSLVEQSAFDLMAAVRAANRARTLDPAFVQANIQYASLLFGAGNRGDAERTIRQVLAVAPDEPMAHSTLGFIQLAQGRSAAARSSLLRALAIDDAQGEPHLGLGILAMREGQHEAAVAEFLAAAALEPRRSTYQTYLAKALYELRRFDQSFAALASAEALDPRDPTPHLYAGIFDNDLTRPGAAVREFEQSIRLNDGRAVYRSRFLLDEDLASRNVNLANAYGRLGLSEWANHHAVESELANAGDSSSHLFLGSTFLSVKGRLNAAGGELLLSRLLGPPNANSFNSLNNYTTLFDRPRADWTLTQAGGTFNSSDTGVNAYGGNDRLAYSAGWGYSRSDGFRPTNDDRHDATGGNLFKLRVTQHGSLLVSYIHATSRQGDHGGGLSALVSDENNPFRRVTSRVDRAEVGYHEQLRPGSDLLLYVAIQTATGVSDDPKATFGFLHTTITTNTPAYSYQAAHLLKLTPRVQLRYGVDLYQGRQKSETNSNLILSDDPPEEVPLSFESHAADVRYRTLFGQATVLVTRRLSAIVGLNRDWANHNDFFLESDQSLTRWNPTAGLSFAPTDSTTFRFAAMRVLQTHYQDRLGPGHVMGFPLAQNESPLSASTAYNLGWDQRLGRDSFMRATAFTRTRTIPLGELCDLVSCHNEFYGGGIVLNRILTGRWTLVPEYAFAHVTDIFGLRVDHETGLATYYVHPSGITVKLREQHLHQRGQTLGEDSQVSVFTTGGSISYELPRKRGLLALTVSNLTGRQYAFLADPLALDTRVPRRQANLSLRVYF